MQSQTTELDGVLLHMIYSPKGEHEGVLIDSDGSPLQLVFDRHDTQAATAFAAVRPGQRVSVAGDPMPVSAKGVGAHPTYAFQRLTAVDGAAPPQTPPAEPGPAYRGRVVRLNHARHGAPNGVVLDSGDFLHLKPDGMARLQSKVGDTVTADGDAQRLVDDSGWAVEVTELDGRPLRGH